MSSTSSERLTGHEYDGICEYDNPTPGWWHAIFVITILFAIGYFVLFHASVGGWTVQESWQAAQLAEFKRIFGSVGELKADEQTLVTELKEAKFQAIAKASFVVNCSACHGRDGGGGVGVNLCDESYKNVTKIEDIFKTITEGAANGAMPAWKTRLSNNERVVLAAYVASLRGSTPASPKAPEGNAIAPWPAAPAGPANP